MRYFKQIMLTTLLVAILAPVPFVAAQNAEPTPEHIATIKAQCVQAQDTLTKFQLSELVTRLDRGRYYEELLRQMAAMNSRFVAHKMDGAELIQTTKDLQSTVDNFRETYDRRYDKALLAAAHIDCRAKPAEFYNQLSKAREERAVMAVYVVEASKVLQRYQELLTKVQADLAAKAAEASN